MAMHRSAIDGRAAKSESKKLHVGHAGFHKTRSLEQTKPIDRFPTGQDTWAILTGGLITSDLLARAGLV
jgi:hypothetical protein